MAYLNDNYLKLKAGYLFPEIARRVKVFCEQNPDAAKRLIRCGIGDVTEPLPRAAIDAMKAAAEELGRRESFRGYGPEQGYEFFAAKSRNSIIATAASTSATTKFFCPTAQSVTAVTSSIFSASKTKSPSPTRFIRFTSIPM